MQLLDAGERSLFPHPLRHPWRILEDPTQRRDELRMIARVQFSNRQRSSLIEMFRNCTSDGGETHLPSFFEPWCCSAIGPRAGTAGSCALWMTVSPFRATVS